MSRTVHDWLVNVDIAVSDFDIKTTIGICAYPSLVVHCRALSTIIGQWDKITLSTLLTLW